MGTSTKGPAFLLNSTYTDVDGNPFYVSMDATLEQALGVFRKFDGQAASLYLVTGEHSMIAWHKHGSKMFEVQVMDDVQRRRRGAQVANEFAEQCLRRVYGGDLFLQDMEGNAFLYVAGEWEPEKDPMYFGARSRDWPSSLKAASR